MRVSRSPPYRRADSSRSHGAFSSRSVSSRYSCTRPTRTRQTATSTDRSPSGTARHARLAVGRQRRLDGGVRPVEPLVALLLPAFGGNVLVEVALRVHEPDADERHAEVAGLLAVIAGQHAETARVNRQRLVQRELGREVRDRLPRQMRKGCATTRCCGPRARRRARRSRGRRAPEIPDRPPRPRAARAERPRASAPGCARSRARACSRAAGRPPRPSGCQLHQRSTASSSSRRMRSGKGGSVE